MTSEPTQTAIVPVDRPTDWWKSAVVYQIYTRSFADSNGDGGVDIDLDGANISPDRVNLAAIYANGAISARLQTQMYLSRDFAGSDARNSFGGYTLTDASLRYQTGVGGFSLSAQNIFDKQYIDYNSDTQRPTDNLRYFAGRGRTWTLGWDTRF